MLPFLIFQIIVKDDEVSCGLGDYIEVGGSSDLETADLETKEDICDWPSRKVDNFKGFAIYPIKLMI